MSLQYRFFQIPAAGDSLQEQELNNFLRIVRVTNVEKVFITEPGPGWSLLVEYYSNKGKNESDNVQHRRKDYRKELSPDDFSLFAAIREWRNKKAELLAQPAYTLFTNEEVAAIAINRPSDMAGLKKIHGIGAAKAKKYGEEILTLLESCLTTEKERQ